MADPPTQRSITSCAVHAKAYTKHDTNAVIPGRSLFVGTGGNVNVRMSGEDGSTNVLFKNVQSGASLPISVKLILSTDTTAADFVVLY